MFNKIKNFFNRSKKAIDNKCNEIYCKAQTAVANAKAEFYKQMSNLTKQGKCILMISSDMPELISMSDRVLVVRDGRIDCELKGEQINEQEIIKRALGVNKDG